MKPGPLNQSRNLGLLLLRACISVYLATHGWGKAQQVFAGQFDKFADPIGIGTGPSLVLAAFAEFVCPILIIMGLATRLACVPIIISMGVAAFVVHANDPWTAARAAELFQAGVTQSQANKEPALMYLIVYLSLLFTGPGAYSIDAAIWPRRRKEPATREGRPI